MRYAILVLLAFFASPAIAGNEARLAPEFIAPAFYIPEIGFQDANPVVIQAQSKTVTLPATTSIETSSPVTTTTVVKGGGVIADVIEWLKVAFGGALAAATTGLIIRGMTWFGVQTTTAMRAQLQGIIVNGINQAADKVSAEVKNDPRFSIDVKNQVVADTIAYTRAHGAETMKALGLDPASGEAVTIIKARIETALNDPNTPTPNVPTLNPLAAKPTVNGIPIEGQKV